MRYCMSIPRLKEGENDTKFQVGDPIVINAKIDGANSSVDYYNNKVRCFKRTELDENNTLDGFWNYIQRQNVKMFSSNPNYIIFGEWMGRKHNIQYNDDVWGKWIIYDIYDKESCRYLSPNDVEQWCDTWGMTYIEHFYEGEFISWEHVKSFCHSSEYGDEQEGVVVKSLNYLNEYDVENKEQPSYIKIVNPEFSEIKYQNAIKRNEYGELAREKSILETIVTKNRVIKEIYKMHDENLISADFTDTDVSIIMDNISARIIADCIKEEKDTYDLAGENADKIASELAIQYAQEYLERRE